MYRSYSFTASALEGGGWSASRPGRFTPGTHCILQETRWSPEPVWTQRLQEKSSLPPPGIEPRSPGRPVRSQTLYWLSYPGSMHIYIYIYIYIWKVLILSSTRWRGWLVSTHASHSVVPCVLSIICFAIHHTSPQRHKSSPLDRALLNKLRNKTRSWHLNVSR
jgi:hypothetical protein